MLISRLQLQNWRNFKKIEVDLRDRVFVIGLNASGKSNLLDTELLQAFTGTVSLPFAAGDNRTVAVKIVDDRGIESLKVMRLGASAPGDH